MASLKFLRNRISSVKSTQKITKAMKMVRELNLFEDDIEKKQKFELIDENEDDLNYQR